MGSKSRAKHFTIKDADPKQLKMGIKVEMEHTSDPKIATRIALDHLAEFKDYYTHLKTMEAAMKGRKIIDKIFGSSDIRKKLVHGYGYGVSKDEQNRRKAKMIGRAWAMKHKCLPNTSDSIDDLGSDATDKEIDAHREGAENYLSEHGL
jgi:hypothetical protein